MEKEAAPGALEGAEGDRLERKAATVDAADWFAVRVRRVRITGAVIGPCVALPAINRAALGKLLRHGPAPKNPPSPNAAVEQSPLAELLGAGDWGAPAVQKKKK